MRIFIIIWLGQTVSIIGSGMTGFAFTIWIWELTHQVTAIALFGLFAQLPQVLIAPIAGFIVDRWNRKYLMIVGDTVSGVVAIAQSIVIEKHGGTLNVNSTPGQGTEFVITLPILA
ncbi:MFS transporter [Nostoc sp. LEGE 12447]|uniref:MFS transporter n=1 Tax=unclassified Nostoc TaxID=2593658 RepID=UPI0013D816FE|nr:MFS transporter [Nostoc sp. LEGE 12447]MBE9000560.1 MFS transporter [Nostoc sp. LEGE 12447]NEU77669.1 hypothetical protein [Nostoc sp. UIC 10630]